MKGTVRITFRLPYDIADTEHYSLEGNLSPEEMLVEMAKYDLDYFPELLEDAKHTSVEFDGWAED